jgi:hypothetical protein
MKDITDNSAPLAKQNFDVSQVELDDSIPGILDSSISEMPRNVKEAENENITVNLTFLKIM